MNASGLNIRGIALQPRPIVGMLALCWVLLGSRSAQASLELNLRFPDGSTSVSVSNADIGKNFSIEVWAKIVDLGGSNGSGTHEGLKFVTYSIASQRVVAGGAGSIDGNLTGQSLVTPFNSPGGQAGILAVLTDDNITDLGSQNGSFNPAFCRPLSSAVTFDDTLGVTGHAVTNGYEFLIERVLFHVDNVPVAPSGGAATRFNLLLPSFTPAADWYQDSDKTAGNGRNMNEYTASASATFNAVATNQWSHNGDGTWSTAANWLQTQPNGVGARANFLNIPSVPLTVTVDAAKTVGAITFNSANSYTIAGTNSLTIDNSGASPIDVVIGDHIISAPLVVKNNVNINVWDGASLTLSGAFSAPGAVAIAKLSEGTLNVNTDLTTKTTLAVQGGAANLGATQHLAALTIAAGAQAVLTPRPPLAADRVLATNGLSLDPVGTLDLTTGALVVHATAGTADQVFADTTAAVRAGYGAGPGHWSNPGITSSTAAADTSRLRAVGVIANRKGGTPRYTTFAGEAVGVNDILARQTLYGDSDLNQVVDGTDYALIDNGFNFSLSGWINGDYNYDNRIDGTDYALIDNAFNFQPPAPLHALVALQSVPEPATFCLFALGLLIVLARCAVRCRR